MPERVFVMPDLGEGLEEGRIVRWLVATGDVVELNQPLVEVETAKAVVEIPSPFAGTILTLHANDGDDVPVEDPLVTISVTGGAVADTDPPRTTPPVRRLAKELGVDVGTVVGTGPEGRLTEADVRAAAPDIAPSAAGEFDAVEVTSVRRDIAKNLTDVAAIPHVTTFRTVDCSAIEAFRSEVGISPLPILLAALSRTYPAHPLLNASWDARGIRAYHHMHVGLAVDTPRGLMVPVVHDVDRRGLDDLATQIRRVAQAAKDGHVSMQDVVGGVHATIGVSNTGTYGSEAGTPLLTPGCAVTLAFGVIADRALVVDGSVVARPAATLSLTFDHRVLDGAAAGRALTDLVQLLQSDRALRDLPR